MLEGLYEHRSVRPISLGAFLVRLARHAAAAGALAALSLLIGMLGYRHFEKMGWADAYVNAAMLLGGMGPMKTDGLSEAGKIFAGTYALYAGLVFIATVGIMLAPVVHRIMHHFHWSKERGGQ